MTFHKKITRAISRVNLSDLASAAKKTVVKGGDFLAENVVEPVGSELDNFGNSIDITDKNSWLSRRTINNPGFFKSLGFSLLPDVIGQGFSNVRRGLKTGINGLINGGADNATALFATTVQTQTPNAYLPLIYGELKLSGNIVFANTSGTNNEFLDVVITICEGSIEAIDDVYIDDVISTDAKFVGLLDIRKYFGSFFQTADALLVSTYADWTSNHRLDGIAYLAIRFTVNRDVFKTLPRISFKIRGKRVYDPRTLTSAYSTNPVLCALDYLTDEIYGASIQLAKFDAANVGALATLAETQIDTGTGNRNLFAIGGIIDTSREIPENIRAILTTFRGTLNDNSTLLSFTSELDSAPVFAFDESNVVGSIAISGNSVDDIYNAYSVDFIDQQSWTRETAVVTNSTYLASDNNVKSELKILLPLSPGRDYALDFGRFLIDSSRAGVEIKFASNASALVCVVHSVVTVTLPNFGYSNRLFRVVNITLNPDLSTDISLIEHNPAIYISGAHFQKYTIPTPSLPNPFFVPIITGFSIATGDGVNSLDPNMIEIGAARLTWDASPNAFVTNYEVQYKLNSDTTWIDATTTVDNDYVLSPLTLGNFVDFRVRAVNINKSVSAYVTQLNVEITQLTSQGLAGAGFAIQDVTGLKIWGDETGNVVVFDGKDAKIEWRHTTGTPYEFGQEPEGGDSGAPDGALKWYRVDTINTLTGLVVRETRVTDNWFFYKLEMNVEDNTTPIRALQFKVYQEDRYNRVSSIPAFISINNPQTQSSELTALSLTPSFDKITVKVNTPKTTDYAGLRIHMSSTPSFTPDATNLIGEFVDNRVTNTVRHIVSNLDSAVTYYFRIAGYDEFSDTGLDFTAEISTTTIQLPSDSISGLSNWATELDPVDLAFIVANIESDSVPSTRIVSLSASKITAGIITAVNLLRFLDSVGGSPSYYGTQIGIIAGTGSTGDIGNDPAKIYLLRMGTDGVDLAVAANWVFAIDATGNIEMQGNIYTGSTTFGQQGMQALINGDFHVGDGAGSDLTFDTNGLALKGATFSVGSVSFFGSGFQVKTDGSFHAGQGSGTGNVNVTYDASAGTIALQNASLQIKATSFGGDGFFIDKDGNFSVGNGFDKLMTFLISSGTFNLKGIDLSLGSNVFGANGIQLFYNSNSPKFHVGDGAGIGLTFDTATGLMSLKGAAFTITNETFGQAGIQMLANGDVHFGNGAGVDLTFDTNGLALKGGKFTITNETFGDSGVQILANGNVHFGDSLGSDFTFDTSDSSLRIGRNVQSPGFDCFSNTSIYHHYIPRTLGAVFNLTGTATIEPTTQQIDIDVSTGLVIGEAYLSISNALIDYDWWTRRRWKTRMDITVFTNANASDFSLGFGSYGANFVGFAIKPGSATINCKVWANGVETFTSTTGIVLVVSPGQNNHIFEIDYDYDNSKITFFINGGLEGIANSITFPTQFAAFASYECQVKNELDGQTTRLHFNELFFVQE